MKRYPSRNKYRAKRTTVNGITFHSQKEARRYTQLKLLQDCGDISELQLQVRFPLIGRNGSIVCKYIADFTYTENGKQVCEDVKGVRTDAYRIKRKLFLDYYGHQWEHRET